MTFRTVGATGEMAIPVSPVTPFAMIVFVFVVGGMMITNVVPVGIVIVFAPDANVVWSLESIGVAIVHVTLMSTEPLLTGMDETDCRLICDDIS